ncbi:MAG: two-component system sensor-response regulator hybrid protein [Limisphaerales bacterium]|nr:MAG: two-component system sensor-response regulator hybrid protein [Limisphaerales bacterium]KAG0506650.1 MAG: two-component system sensor-response regulator hybrid protein [Limisphaerales bacterium]TXT44629.1 MAG: two-component system sensor-response regulator hybrid protein [Limisphaerales bacterium]
MSADPQPTAGAVSSTARDAAQRESSAFQRAILECADYSIISTTPEGLIHTFNRAAERLLGYRAEEVVGQVTPEIIHDYDEVARRAAELTAELGRPVPAGFEAFVAKARLGLADEQEWTYIRKDGSRFPVQLSVTAMRDEAGQIIGFMGIAHDISRRREAQARVGQLAAQLDRRVRERTAQVAASEERFRLVVEASPSGLLMVDREGRIVLVNAQLERLFGYTRAELIGQPVDLLVPERSRPGHAGQRAAFCAAPQARGMGAGRDLFGRRKDGSEFPVEIGLSPLETAEGMMVLGTVVDISQRKEVELRLRASEERLRLAQQAARVGTFEWNIQTGVNIWSPELEAMHGLPPGGFPGTHPAWEKLVHPEDLARAKSQVQRAFETREPVEGEWRVVWPDGGTRWLFGRFQVFRDAAGQPLRLTGVNLDITERKRAERVTATFAELGRRLSAVDSRRAAAGTIMVAADQLLHFDAALLHLFSADRRRVIRVLTVDTVNGWRAEQPGRPEADEPSLMFRRVLKQGAQLVLRRGPEDVTVPFEPFGDGRRESASLMFVPLRAGENTLGVLSLQSYTPQAYTPADLELLQALADHAAGAFERLEAEETLAESEQRFRGTFEQAAVGVAHVGLDGRWLRVNDWVCDIVGYSREELMTKTFQDITHPEDLAPDLDNVRRLLAGELPHYGMDKRYFHKDGSLVWVRLTVSLVREADGRPKYFISIIQDIRARKEAERKLAETALFPGENPHPVLRVGREGAIIYANPASQALLAAWGSAVGGRPPAALGEVIAAALASGSRTTVDVTLGEQVFLLNVAPIRTAGYVNLYGQDITERKRAEEALLQARNELERRVQTRTAELRESEARLRTIIDTAHDAFIGMDDQGRVTDWNPQAEATFGWPRSEALGRLLAELIIPEAMRAAHQRGLVRFLQTGQGTVTGRRLDLTGVDRAGREFPIELTIAPIQRAGGWLFSAFLRDISERKQAEARLRASEARLRTIIDSTPDWIFIKDREFRYQMANEGYAKAFKLRPEDFLGKTDLDLGLPTELVLGDPARGIRGFRTDDREVMDTGQMKVIPEEPGAADGEPLVLSTVKVPLRDATGKVTGVLGYVRDITERKAMEAELRSREEQLRDLFENATDLIQSVAPDGRILFVNRAWLNTLGYRMGELAGLTIFDILHPDCLADCREHFAQVMRGEPLTSFEAIFRAKDGRKIHVEGNANARFENGRAVATRGIFRDISKRKAVEEERERLIAELQAALAEVKTLSGLLPVCGWCKKIRDDSGYWNSVEGYLKKTSGVDTTHGICPECQAKMMADLDRISSDGPETPPAS